MESRWSECKANSAAGSRSSVKHRETSNKGIYDKIMVFKHKSTLASINQCNSFTLALCNFSFGLFSHLIF